ESQQSGSAELPDQAEQQDRGARLDGAARRWQADGIVVRGLRPAPQGAGRGTGEARCAPEERPAGSEQSTDRQTTAGARTYEDRDADQGCSSTIRTSFYEQT